LIAPCTVVVTLFATDLAVLLKLYWSNSTTIQAKAVRLR
jgi:hypothetical protein